MIEVTPRTHAWAYEKDDNPQRFIAALELLGDIHLVQLLGERYPGQGGTYGASGTTDNQGNMYIINKHYTQRYPNLCLCMELTDKLTQYDLYLRVEHRDRSHNEWADQLAGLDPTGYDPAKRFYPDLTLPTFDRTRRMAKQMELDKPRELKEREYHEQQQARRGRLQQGDQTARPDKRRTIHDARDLDRYPPRRPTMLTTERKPTQFQ